MLFEGTGYLTNKIQRVDIITGAVVDTFNHPSPPLRCYAGSKRGKENKFAIYESINYLYSIKFGVNNLMLEYLLSVLRRSRKIFIRGN